MMPARGSETEMSQERPAKMEVPAESWGSQEGGLCGKKGQKRLARQRLGIGVDQREGQVSLYREEEMVRDLPDKGYGRG